MPCARHPAAAARAGHRAGAALRDRGRSGDHEVRAWPGQAAQQVASERRSRGLIARRVAEASLTAFGEGTLNGLASKSLRVETGTQHAFESSPTCMQGCIGMPSNDARARQRPDTRIVIRRSGVQALHTRYHGLARITTRRFWKRPLRILR